MDLIRRAFDLIEADVVGELPAWVTTMKFDVVARSSEGPLTHSRLRRMSQAMLRDRFRLEASFERVELPVYALVMERSDSKPGPNLRPSASDCVVDPLVKERSLMPVKVLTVGEHCGIFAVTNSGGLNAIGGNGITLHQLARGLSRHGRFDKPVVDQTGLSGVFDILAVASADMTGATNEARLVTAMREQLGLALRSGQGTVEGFRIRRIEQPSPN